jgi:integrase/recombinase XerD
MSGRFHGRGRSPERACRRLEEWPALDRLLWGDAHRAGDILDPGGSRAKYRPSSNRKSERGYGRWLTFFDRYSGLNDGPPGDRITPDAVEAYVSELRQFGNATHTILGRLQELHDAALVMNPEQHWTWIRRIASRVRAHHAPARDKRCKLVGTDDLLQLGFQLMAKAAARPDHRRSPLIFRDGLLTAFVALRPLRRKNLTGLTLELHVVRIAMEWHIVISDNETKTSAPLEYPWPEALVAALERYLSKYRPVLCALRGRWYRPAGNALWISSHGSPMTAQAIYEQITKRTKAAFGKAVNPHLFRDIAATTLAHADPKRVRVAAQLLGHRNFGTTERFYLQADTVQATRRFQQEILRRRRGTGE